LRFGTALHAALRVVTSKGGAPSRERVEAIGRYYELADGEVERLETAVRRYCGTEVAARAQAGKAIRRESPFAMRIGDRFLLTGAIDLYSRTGNSALVIDYKSGRQADAAVLTSRYRLQAECYGLAVLRDGCEHVTVEFVRPEAGAETDPVQGAVFTFETRDVDRIEAGLVRRYAEIEASSFLPAVSDRCRSCDVPTGLCARAPRTAAGSRGSESEEDG
jgi:hypothetical protein